MVYRKKTFRKKTYRRKKTPWYNKRYSTMQLATKALRGVNYIRGLVNSEMLHADLQLSLGSVQQNIQLISGLGQGDSVSGRTGNSVLSKSIVMNGYMYIDPTQTANTRVSLALIRDNQQVEDTNPSNADIFTSNVDPSTLLKVGNLGRFTILWRKQYTLEGVNATASAKQFKAYVPLNFHTRFNGTGSSDTQKNHVYFSIITSEPTKYPTVVANVRYNYHDN